MALHDPAPAILIVAAFSRYADALARAREQCQRAWGPATLVSPAFVFASPYYQRTMGTGLTKQFWAFADAPGESPAGFGQGDLSAAKRLALLWEDEEIARAQPPGELRAEPRPVNVDPGYITEAKLVLASTKDRDHRLYLRDGIYAEMTLFWQFGAWHAHPWTYPDYRRADYHEFFTRCREQLRSRKALRRFEAESDPES